MKKKIKKNSLPQIPQEFAFRLARMCQSGKKYKIIIEFLQKFDEIPDWQRLSQKIPAVGWSKHSRGMRKNVPKKGLNFRAVSWSFRISKICMLLWGAEPTGSGLTLKRFLANCRLICPEVGKSELASSESASLRENRENSSEFSLNARLVQH